MVFVFGYPLVQVVRDSFYAGSFDSPIWVGLDNYRGVIDDPEFRQSLAQQPEAAARSPGDARPRARDRPRAERPHPWHAQVPGHHLPAVRAAGDGHRHLVLVPPAAERRPQHGAPRRTPRSIRPGLAGNSHLAIVSVGGLVVWQQLGFGVVVFTAALLALPPETPKRRASTAPVGGACSCACWCRRSARSSSCSA